MGHPQPLRTERRVFHRLSAIPPKKKEIRTKETPPLSPPLSRPLNQSNPSTIILDLSLCSGLRLVILPSLHSTLHIPIDITLLHDQSDPCHPSVPSSLHPTRLFFTLLLFLIPPLSSHPTFPLHYTELKQTFLVTSRSNHPCVNLQQSTSPFIINPPHVI